MTERIRLLKEHYISEKRHHAARVGEIVDPAPYRLAGVPDHRRTALRLKAMLDAETPVINENERIVATRTVSDAPRVFTDAEWADITANHYIHERGTVCNLSPDYGKIIKSGLLAARGALGDTEHDESARISIDAVLDFAHRYEVKAREMNMPEVAETLARVPAYGARNLREALQSLRILHFAMWCEGDYHNTLGRFDQYMLPYMNGVTDEEALDLIEEFFLACNRDSDLYPGMQQGDNGQSIVAGGMLPDGENGYNRLSPLLLKASGELRVIDPKINLRVDKNTPQEVFELGTQLTKLGLGFPQYENDDVVIPGLIKLGYAPEDARNYVVAACWEFIIPGRGMEIPNIGAMPIASVVDRAIRETLPGAESIEKVITRAGEIMMTEAANIAGGVKNLYVTPSPYLSLFFDVAPGRDIADGCIYNNYGVHGTGIATAADSLAAVQKLVFEDNFPADRLIAAMDGNFENEPELLYALRNCPKMGNDDDRADKFAERLLELFAKSVKSLKNERAGMYRAGTGAAMYYIWHAANMGATADGRLAGTPLPANYAPSLGVKLNGPVSLLRSFSKGKLSDAINGGPVTIEFHDTVFKNAEAISKAAALVRAFIQWGGHQLQLNTVNAEVLRDAQAHPESYKNLIVRVWGWSGYFVELDKCYQDHIIKRVELTL